MSVASLSFTDLGVRLDDLRRGLAAQSVAYCLTAGKRVVHLSWLSREPRSAIFDGLFPALASSPGGFIGPCETAPDFQGRGLYPFTLLWICAELAFAGVRWACISARTANSRSERGILKAGFDRGGIIHSLSLGSRRWLVPARLRPPA